jgi:hypothetical protein
MRTIKFFFFCRFRRRRFRRRGTIPPLFWQLLRSSKKDSLQKSDWIFGWTGALFSRFSRDFILRDFDSHFDTFTKTFNHGRTSRKQQQQQQQRHQQQQQLRKRESERASSKNFVRKKISQKRFSERVRAREFLWIKISTYKNGDERLR